VQAGQVVVSIFSEPSLWLGDREPVRSGAVQAVQAVQPQHARNMPELATGTG
jgi:hypothetical protein